MIMQLLLPRVGQAVVQVLQHGEPGEPEDPRFREQDGEAGELQHPRRRPGQRDDRPACQARIRIKGWALV